MQKIQLFPDKMKILSGSMLKVIAVTTMLIDHVASYLIPQKWVLFTVFGYDVRLYRLMRNLGRWAFPIFAVLLIEGFLHTHSRLKYGISLAAFALISEIPWNLVHTGTLLYQGQNVFSRCSWAFWGCAYWSICKTAFCRQARCWGWRYCPCYCAAIIPCSAFPLSC